MHSVIVHDVYKDTQVGRYDRGLLNLKQAALDICYISFFLLVCNYLPIYKSCTFSQRISLWYIFTICRASIRIKQNTLETLPQQSEWWYFYRKRCYNYVSVRYIHLCGAWTRVMKIKRDDWWTKQNLFIAMYISITAVSDLLRSVNCKYQQLALDSL